jgi:hypothetical protein
MSRHAFAAVVVLVAGVAGLPAFAQTDDVVVSYMEMILERMDARPVQCAQAIQDAYAGSVMMCGNYGGNFSSFKADWEKVLRQFDLKSKVIASDSWVLRRGIYHRDYKAETASLKVTFDPSLNQFVLSHRLEELKDDDEGETASETSSD